MENYTNQAFLDQRSKYARWGSWVGFGALAIGLLITSRSPLIAYVFLLIGLLGATFGSYMTNRYVREPRSDQVLADALSGLDKRYNLYNYYLPSNHVVASHFGLTVIEPRPQMGQIIHEGGRWQHKAGWRKLLQIFGEPSLGKPDQDLEREIEGVREWIDQVFPDDKIPVNGAVVFTNPHAELEVTNAAVPILQVDALVEHMKQTLKGGPVLSTAEQKELRRVLDEVVAQG